MVNPSPFQQEPVEYGNLGAFEELLKTWLHIGNSRKQSFKLLYVCHDSGPPWTSWLCENPYGTHSFLALSPHIDIVNAKPNILLFSTLLFVLSRI